MDHAFPYHLAFEGLAYGNGLGERGSTAMLGFNGFF